MHMNRRQPTDDSGKAKARPPGRGMGARLTVIVVLAVIAAVVIAVLLSP